ncbi:MAG: penicillin acylase family protein [Rhodospirillaceae bacterium]|nr:penicillin acylase family protein [Rhodospirillaceae bacterium]MBT7250062.1 penicillin acylase family protein [Rhodospirillaceae bacterium]
MRPYKIILRFFALVGVLIVGLGAWLATSLPWYASTIRAGGVVEPVEILRDNNAVPHIFAKTETDAYFALGVVHAQDRFWQMEMMRRFGAGRLAEVLGENVLASDKWMRLLGLYRLAEKMVEDVPPEVRAALDAYASGVNFWLQEDFGLLAPEFALFYFTPEPWKPADSLVWGKIMASQLGGNWRAEVLRARLAAKLRPEKVRELWPAYPADGPVSVAGLIQPDTIAALAGLDDLPPWPHGLPKGASNVWALGGTENQEGGAILANDPHLGFSAPVLWYLARIETPNYSVTGATVPGVPFTILGQAGALAWGMTSTQSDIEDLFVEKLDANEKDRYVTPDGSQAFTVRKEVIKVSGGDDVTLQVRATRHGPVISDLSPGAANLVDKDHVVALSATYLQPGDKSPAAFYRLSRAINWVSFKEALANFQAPQQNFFYASKDDLVGFTVAGLAPVRGRGEGFVPTAGWIGDTDWQGFVAADDLPNKFNPDNRRVYNANNRVAGPGYRHFLGYDWAAPYRAERILEMLRDGKGRTMGSNQAMQRDAESKMARDLLPLMLKAKSEVPKSREALAMLWNWDSIMDRNRPEPLIFATWLLELNKVLYGDELGDDLRFYLGARPMTVHSMLTRRTHWCDDVTTDKTEDCRATLTRALEKAITGLVERFGDDIDGWRWGAVHTAHFPHPVLTHVPVVRWLADLNIETDGGSATLNRGAMRLNDPKTPFRHIHGAGYRAVYNLKDPRKSRYVIATGQSGNPLSLNYRHFLKSWSHGQFIPLGQTHNTLKNQSEARTMIEPAKGK